jgi:signal transduction histidine kinase
MSIVAAGRGWPGLTLPSWSPRPVPAKFTGVVLISSVDLLLATVTLALALTPFTVVLFHLVFVVLTFDAFFSSFRAFAIRSGFWVTVNAAQLVTWSLAGRLEAGELTEIPMMYGILLGVFVLAHRQVSVNRRLRVLASQKAEFTAMVAHELGTPLAAVRMLTSMLASGGLDASTQSETIAHIEGELEVLTALIADVRGAAVVEQPDFSLHLTQISAASIIADGLAFAQSLRAVDVTAHAEADCRVWADAERIGQVIRNLLSNAAKYAASGGPIELRARCERGRLRIEVADRGPGVAAQDAAIIFEKFARGRARSAHRAPGAGLGLYVSREIVRAHGAGDLVVRPNPGGGAIFAFDLERVA